MEKKEPGHMYTTALKYHHTQSEIDLEAAEIDAAVENMSRFSVLYDRYYIRIFRFVFQRLGNEDQTADVTSRVFLNAMLHLKSYRHKGYPFASWLYRIARNEINQEFRRNKADRSFQSQWSEYGELTAELEEAPDETLMNKLELAMKKLNRAETELVEMRYFEKRSFKEIGEILEMTENNAKVKMFRIIQKLKKRMKV